MRTFPAMGFGLGPVLAAAMVAIAPPAAAHHAFAAEFDATKPVRLRGTITRMEWINPHSWIHLDVPQEDGSVESWMIEAGPAGVLVRRGWSRDSIAPGTEVLVEGYQAPRRFEPRKRTRRHAPRRKPPVRRISGPRRRTRGP